MDLFGAVISRTLGYFVMTIISLWIARKVVNFEVKFYKVFFTLMFFIPFFFINYLPVPYGVLLTLKISLSIIFILHFARSITINYFGVRRKLITLKQYKRKR